MGRPKRREQRRSEDGKYETGEGESRKKDMRRETGGKGEEEGKQEKER